MDASTQKSGTNHVSAGGFPVSVMILTKDEEINIQACLETVGFSDDVVVFDSHSTDRTVEIAETFDNVRVIKRPFDNWSAHQNWAVANIDFRHPWVLYIDADERVDDEMREEVMRVADPASKASAFRMRRKDMFMGRWLRHAQIYPTWFTRMFRPSKIRYERLVNPIAVVDGPTKNLKCHIMHYPFSKGVHHWLERHNSYSMFEAKELIKVTGGQRAPRKDIFSGDPAKKRAALKDIFFTLPFRPQIKWAYYVFWRRAFLDGKAGMIYSRLQYMYEYMIVFKARELRMKEKGEQL